MKKLLFVFPIVALLAAACSSSQPVGNQTSTAQNTTVAVNPAPAQTSSVTENGWVTYANQDLSISFKYPPNYKVYQQDATHLSINSDYKDPQYPAVRTIQMGISQVSQIPETTTEVQARFLPNVYLVAPVTSQSKNNYTLFHFQDSVKGSVYYIQSGKGTFLIDSSLLIFKQLWNKQNINLQKYSDIFDQIVSTIKIE